MFPSVLDSKCLFESDQTIVITLSSTVSYTQLPSIGDTIVLLDKVIKASCKLSAAICAKASFNRHMSLVISAPNNAITPSIVLSTPSKIGECSDILLDASRTSGKAGRPWKEVKWSATSTNGYNINAINYNISLLQDTNKIFSISRDDLDAGVYTFSLQIKNWLDQTALLQKSVEVISSSALPVVNILGSSVISMYKYQPLAVFALASVPTCSGGLDSNTRVVLTYSWALFRGVRLLNGIIFDNTSKDKRYFKLNANTLDPADYTLQVTVSTSSQSSSSSVSIQVSSSGVAAVLKGSEFRVFSYRDTFILDASASNALDFPPSNYPLYLTYISFSWTCVELSPNYGASCNITLSNEKNAQLTVKGSNIHNENNTIEDFYFTVFVKNDISSASSSTTIRILDVPELPKVSISAPASKYNVDQKIILSGIVDVQRPAYAKWVLLDDSLNLNDISIVPTIKYLQKGIGQYQISMKQNVFIPGVSYSLKLIASYDQSKLDQSQSYSSVTIRINAPPSNGKFNVEPMVGVALKDKFLFKTSDWSDDPEDYPLLVSFSYYTVNALNTVIIKGSDEVWSVETTLGQGLASMNFAVVCVTTCKDNLASENKLNFTTTVNEAAATEVQRFLSFSIIILIKYKNRLLPLRL